MWNHCLYFIYLFRPYFKHSRDFWGWIKICSKARCDCFLQKFLFYTFTEKDESVSVWILISELSLNFCVLSSSAAGGLGLLSSSERLTVVDMTAFFDSKLRLAVMASRTDCCHELSRGHEIFVGILFSLLKLQSTRSILGLILSILEILENFKAG